MLRAGRRHSTICAFVSALLLTAGRLTAQELKLYSATLPDGAASVGADWAELLFPPQELSEMGCARAHWTAPQQGPVRVYSWGAQTRFVDAFTGPTDHFTTLFVQFAFPDSAPVTSARLDSALASADLYVLEYGGEPPSPIDRVKPTRASVRREERSVRIRIEGKEAVRALLRPRGDSIDLNRCQHENGPYVFPWRTRVVGGAASPPKVPVYTAADSAAAFAAAIDAVFADDASAARAQRRYTSAPARPESLPVLHVQIGRWPEEHGWAAPSIARARSWPWRALRWTADSTRGFREVTGGPAPNVSAAFPSQISLGFYFLADTVQMTEYRLFLTCKDRPNGKRPIWYRTHILAPSSSGWRQIRTESAMATTYCN